MITLDSLKELTDEQALSGSETYVKLQQNEILEMPHPMKIREQMKDFVEDENISIKLANPRMLKDRETGDLKYTYDNYMIYGQRRLFDNNTVLGDYKYNVGIIINNSANKMVVYAGVRAQACLNLCVFGGQYVWKDNIKEQAVPFLFEAATTQLSESDAARRLENMYSVLRYESTTMGKIGNIVHNLPLNCFKYVKHAESIARDSKDSRYNTDNLWGYYNAMTDKIYNQSPTSHIDDTKDIELALAKITNTIW